MTNGEPVIEDFMRARSEDAWYELEGAYEVYGIGRCRFVLVHCRTALLMGVAVLARKKGLPWQGAGIGDLARTAGMPPNLVGSLSAVVSAGSYPTILNAGPDDQEVAAAVLSRTLEVFEWIRNENVLDANDGGAGKR